MSKTSDRLKDYQTQMSIYAEQHKIILANDVLDMIEQLQEDLEDDIEKVVGELEEYAKGNVCKRFPDGCPYKDEPNILCENCGALGAIDIVKRGSAK